MREFTDSIIGIFQQQLYIPCEDMIIYDYISIFCKLAAVSLLNIHTYAHILAGFTWIDGRIMNVFNIPQAFANCLIPWISAIFWGVTPLDNFLQNPQNIQPVFRITSNKRKQLSFETSSNSSTRYKEKKTYWKLSISKYSMFRSISDLAVGAFRDAKAYVLR